MTLDLTPSDFVAFVQFQADMPGAVLAMKRRMKAAGAKFFREIPAGTIMAGSGGTWIEAWYVEPHHPAPFQIPWTLQ